MLMFVERLTKMESGSVTTGKFLKGRCSVGEF